MKLNEVGKDKIRTYIEQMIENESENLESKISLASGLLEQLIFKQEKIDGKIVKFPIWTGSFLKHIDLSGVSCYNVCWNLTACKSIQYNEYAKKHNGYDIDFSGTNVRIDFKECINFSGKPRLLRCNFEGVDLSKNSLSANEFESSSIRDCNFKYTEIDIVFQPTENSDIYQFAEMIRNHEFDGCCINGRPIRNIESLQQMKAEQQQLYQKFLENKMDYIKEAIQKAKKKDN